MTNETQHDVGLCIQEAIARGEAHTKTSTRKLTVRLFNYPEGFTVLARIAVRNGEELEALNGLGFRVIPWAALSERAREIPALVDQCVMEVEAALRQGKVA